MKDLFGVEVADVLPPRKSTEPRRGHAARPGTGPAGETCKSCEHYTLRHFAKTYRKCGLVRAAWTRGPGTDIRAKDPACQFWQGRQETSNERS